MTFLLNGIKRFFSCRDEPCEWRGETCLCYSNTLVFFIIPVGFLSLFFIGSDIIGLLVTYIFLLIIGKEMATSSKELCTTYPFYGPGNGNFFLCFIAGVPTVLITIGMYYIVKCIVIGPCYDLVTRCKRSFQPVESKEYLIKDCHTDYNTL